MRTKPVAHDFFKSIEQRNRCHTLKKSYKWHFDFQANIADLDTERPDVVLMPVLSLCGVARRTHTRTAKTSIPEIKPRLNLESRRFRKTGLASILDQTDSPAV